MHERAEVLAALRHRQQRQRTCRITDSGDVSIRTPSQREQKCGGHAAAAPRGQLTANVQTRRAIKPLLEINLEHRNSRVAGGVSERA